MMTDENLINMRKEICDRLDVPGAVVGKHVPHTEEEIKAALCNLFGVNREDLRKFEAEENNQFITGDGTCGQA